MGWKETEKQEFKKSTAELKEAITSIVAILNKHQEGELFFGVKNDGEIYGQQIGSETIRDISREVANNIEPKIYPTITSVKLNDKPCIKVHFKGKETPYYAYGRVLHRVHLVEKWGKGIELILSKEPTADFEEVGRKFFTVFKRKEVVSATGQTTQKSSEKSSEKILAIIRGDNGISMKEIAVILKKSTRAIEKQIAILKKQGLLKRIGPDKGGRWEVVNK